MKTLILTFLLVNLIFNSFPQGQIATQYKEKGTKLAKEGNYTEAIENLNKAIQIEPNYAAAYNNRGIVKMQLKQYEEAIADFTQAIKINNQDPAYFINRGITREKINKIHEAINDYGSAIDLEPYNPEYYVKRGILYDRLKEYKKAVEDFNMAIKFDQNNADYYYFRGLSKLSSEEYFDGHKDLFKAAQMGSFKSKNMIIDVFFNNISDDEEFALSVRSSMKLHLKDYEGAIEDLDKLIKISPKNGKYYLTRGVAKIRSEKRSEGCRDLKKALNLREYEAQEEFERYCE